MAIIVSCPQEVKLFMLGALFCGCSLGAATGGEAGEGRGERGRGSGLINNYASTSSLPPSPASYCPSRMPVLSPISHLVLFPSAAVTAATLRLICADARFLARTAAHAETRSSEN
jgi:hypothetical protein